MIIDHLSRAELYYGISKNLKAGLQFLQQTDFTSISPQKLIIDGDEVFAMVQEYETQKAEENVLEAHKKYADIHFMVEGEENIGYEFLNNQSLKVAYQEQDDYWLFFGNPSFNLLRQGMIAIYWPHDLHLPRIMHEEIKSVRKVVVKVRV